VARREGDKTAALTFAIGGLVALLLAAGVAYQRIGARRGARQYPPPGTMIEVEGQRLHAVCAGSGQPAVVFESGIAASSLSWTSVLRAASLFTRACAYDRAGLGWSASPRGRRTVARMISELRGVAAEAAGGAPYVLVGHSFGALLVSVFASRHPGDVAGLVLLDPPSEWHSITREQARLLWGGKHLSRIGGILAEVGVVRACLALLTGGAPGVPRNFVRVFGPTAARTLERLVGEVRKLPPEVHPVVQAIWCQPKCFRAMADHLDALEETAAAAEGITSLPGVPLTIVSAGDQSPATIAKHRQLAGLSPHGRHIVAARSGHWIQFDEPELVVSAIHDIVIRVRGSSAA
jgi:pimeloyl-ACP methyl ester carboxylesterase